MRLWHRLFDRAGRERGERRTPVEWLIVGLGNPGRRYAVTRHNMGRDVVAAVARAHGASLDQVKHNARFSLATIAGTRVCLAVPTTYMNESGRAVAPLARFYQVPPESVLVVYDELDLPLGRIRLRARGGTGGHRGLSSVASALGTDEVPRLRVGIGRPPPQWDPADYVLAPFTPDERVEADQAVQLGAEAVEAVIRDGIVSAMNVYN